MWHNVHSFRSRALGYGVFVVAKMSKYLPWLHSECYSYLMRRQDPKTTVDFLKVKSVDFK